MDEEETALTGALDTAAPWTIKSIPRTARDNIMTLARQRGVTVGNLLDKMARDAREEIPGLPEYTTRPDDLLKLVECAERLAALDKGLGRLAAGVVRDRLRGMRTSTDSRATARLSPPGDRRLETEN